MVLVEEVGRLREKVGKLEVANISLVEEVGG